MDFTIKSRYGQVVLKTNLFFFSLSYTNGLSVLKHFKEIQLVKLVSF